ncbi:thiamine pyrophosphate-binding protein [Flavobacteriaceae bacterium]|jgi:2-succinyl-5-enolpyruvyl-6-hydroxy-3-cyclohexene-1-carboxylate synthase|nr:thiamine pyrophosphate-binding protein [Flavobacteriaceae bacterium]
MSTYPSIPLAQTVVRLCEAAGVERIVICAGSRNAPLTNGFVSQPFFKTYSIVDERAAAFFALGMAQQLREPVAVVCTSGSALLNFYPAVAEAYYSDIPLVILSADRMPHRIDIGDGQTIRQTGVFEPHLDTAAVLKPDVIHATETLLENPMQALLPPQANFELVKEIQNNHQKHNEIEIVRVLETALKQSGPVHLNIPLEEPLYETTSEKIPLPKVKTEIGVPKVAPSKIKSLSELWNKYDKKWVIVGTLAPNCVEKKWIDALCEDPSVVVFTETTSNIKHPNAIHSIDTLLAPLEQVDEKWRKRFQPKILLTFGGMVVSKKIKAFLRKYRPQHHWHVDVKKAYNTYYSLTEHLKTTPQYFLNALYSAHKKGTSDFQSTVHKSFVQCQTLGEEYLKKVGFSDLKVFEVLSAKWASGYQLQLANSSSIRYAQLFSWPTETQIFCNRGTSGIDGSTATAVGAALASEQPTMLITGDLSFFYDINGLWNNYIPSNFKIILINNGGGGIFRILPGEKDSAKYDTYFETIHQRNAKYVAKAFGFKYRKVNSLRALKRKLPRFFNSNSVPQILEIQTPRKVNDTVLLNYFKTMASKSIFS